MTVTVALLGNPNVGKTVLFNRLTGGRQRVGNWPGVTVERKQGTYVYADQGVRVVDLPGVYRLGTAASGSLDTRITSEYVHARTADCVVNVIDGSQLERNLYLTRQLIESGQPVVVAVNMLDLLKRRGHVLHLKKLQRRLGCPVVGLVANQGRGIAALQAAIHRLMRAPRQPKTLDVVWPTALCTACDAIVERTGLSEGYAIRLLEGDALLLQRISLDMQAYVIEQQQECHRQLGEEPDIVLADARYQWAATIVSSVLQWGTTPRRAITMRLDRLVLHRLWGIPIFLCVMYALFVVAINLGGVFQDLFDGLSRLVCVDGLSALLTQWHWPAWLVGILADGVGVGINTTVTFIPVIGAMFLCLSFLEDSGYMARAVFVVDRVMRVLGLPGQSFVPMILGFGCNVPAVMSARTLSNPRDRLLTVLMMPFMSCGARLAIFAVFVHVFFAAHAASVIFSLYVLGIVAAALTGLVLRQSVLKGKTAPLLMELPPYHWPEGRTILRQTRQRLSHFLSRASRVIIPVCVALGLLNSVTWQGSVVTSHQSPSVLESMGQAVTPVLAPMGIQRDNWPATVSLLTGVLAKEVVIGTLNSLYHHDQGAEPSSVSWHTQWVAAWRTVPENWHAMTSALYNPVAASATNASMDRTAMHRMAILFGSGAAAFSYLLFVLLYFPCVSTMAVMAREVGSRWMWFSVFWNTGLAYMLAVACYQLSGIGAHIWVSLSWILLIVTCCSCVALCLRRWLARQKVSALEGSTS